ncbi:MAG: hypothetical protein Q9217_000625 [Psora testacea]
MLTLVLFVWHWRRTRARGQKIGSDKSQTKPARKLTLREGRVIPVSEAVDTASTREPYSLDLESPDIEKQFEFDVEKGFTKERPVKASKKASRRSLRSPQKERPTWASGRPPWLQRAPEVSTRRSGEFQQRLKPPAWPRPRDRSRSLPRPSLINIERRGSSQTARSHQSIEPVPSLSMRQSDESKPSLARQRRGSDMTPEMQRKRRGMGITESLYNAYKGPGPWVGELHELPASPIFMPGAATTAANSRRNSRYRWSMPATSSVYSSIPATASFVSSSRVVSQPDSIQPPPPLFSKVNYSPHVSFAPTHDINRQSFLSMTESPTSSTSTERAFLGPKAPHPSVAELSPAPTGIPTTTGQRPAYNEQARPMRAPSLPTPNALEVVERVRAFGQQHRERPSSIVPQDERSFSTVSRRPPSVEVEIPHTETGSMSFFDAIPPPSNVGKGRELTRGPSVMSDRSGMTIASSEISSNWTIGKAELVNIYPSVADGESEQGVEGSERASVAPSASERATPPYAKMLRSKFGQYPRGRRDKALPTLPKSPLGRLGSDT